MASYFKDVNDVAEWFYEPYEADGGGACRSYVLERQRALAERAVSKGGFILSHIKGVRCWAGVARIAGNELLKSDGNGWGQVFPHFFRIEPLHVLRTQARCFLVREAVVRSGYDGRGIYTQMHDAGACERIHSGIEAVASMTEAAAEAEANSQPSDFEVFKRAWKDSLSRSTFLRDLAIMQSKGHCAICGTTRQDWIERVKLHGEGHKHLDIERVLQSDCQFLHAHHLKWVKDGGTAELENLVAVCPNCHELITRCGSPSQAKTTTTCPGCGSGKVIPIVYGFPLPETMRRAKKGLVQLGGCCEETGAPDSACKSCGHEWRKAGTATRD